MPVKSLVVSRYVYISVHRHQACRSMLYCNIVRPLILQPRYVCGRHIASMACTAIQPRLNNNSIMTLRKRQLYCTDARDEPPQTYRIERNRSAADCRPSCFTFERGSRLIGRISSTDTTRVFRVYNIALCERDVNIQPIPTTESTVLYYRLWLKLCYLHYMDL